MLRLTARKKQSAPVDRSVADQVGGPGLLMASGVASLAILFQSRRTPPHLDQAEVELEQRRRIRA